VSGLGTFQHLHGGEIAIIGMAGRFPGAKTVGEFWRNLRDGVESISFFSDRELIASGINAALLHKANYVKAGGALENVEWFDPAFFGYTPKEAEILDPQQRIFLECAWEALEDAGYDSETYAGPIGVYAGAGNSGYLLNLYSNQSLMASLGALPAFLANEKDFLSTRVSYKLNLRGPSIGIQTACSTSLVAIHLASQGLLTGECDIAVAGGVTIALPQSSGYVYREGGINSPDGHCRAFDAKAGGTVSGNGVAIVVLKRLDDAVADGDSIRAVIKGSAINNDGSLKIGYTAPSVDGQADVIAEAIAMAGIDPETITYIEAHGTGTALGDPIEVAALTQAFTAKTDKKRFCAIGSVKTNIGHLDAAAGAAGLIKAVLALVHRMIPPSLHFEQPNPKIDLANSPFYVNTRLREWEATGAPRRAGVSCFGIGGTNAHVILEEAPLQLSSDPSRPWHLLPLSAKTATALESTAANLRTHLKNHPDLNLADVAYTLQVGRRAFPHRRIAVCRSIDDALAALESLDSNQVWTAELESLGSSPRVVFMFPGQGARYGGMASELYRLEPTFREQVDYCSQLLTPHMALDLRTLLQAAPGEAREAGEQLTQTANTQPALFVIEYALARLWMEWGIRPQAMIGHSLGEYVAACLAGVFTLEEALALVAARGRLMQKMPQGAMLAVPLSEAAARRLLGRRLSLAAVNGPSRCVVSGATDDVSELERDLSDEGVECLRLYTSRAFHSAMMEAVVRPFTDLVAKVALKPPRMACLSNVTGTWMTAADATDPAYWGRHLCSTVRFGDGLNELLKEPRQVLLEVGPGRTLSPIAKHVADKVPGQIVLSSLPHRHGQQSDLAFLLTTLGQLWLAGAAVDWSSVHARDKRHRIPLPTYPFERKRCWIERPKNVTDKRLSENPRNADPLTQPLAFRQTEPSPSNGKESGVTMPEPQPRPMPGPARKVSILSSLRTIVNRLTGIGPEKIRVDQPFLELGVDSLLLIQGSQSIRKRFGVEIPLRQMMEEGMTLDTLAEHIDRLLPLEELPTQASKSPARDFFLQDSGAEPPLPFEAAGANGGRNGSASLGPLERVMAQQLQLMSQQLDLLRGGWAAGEGNGKAALPGNAAESLLASAHVCQPHRTAAANSGAAAADPGRTDPEAYVPYRPIDAGSTGGLTPHQQKHLDALIARYTERTKKSKQLNQIYRPVLADNRMSAGFRLLWKEMVYPIIGARSSGSMIWDVDGNEYVDLTMGFGTHLFGHSPRFILDALREQLDEGLQLGPQSNLAGEVAELIRDLTGVERVTFCNSGTEAVMAALRVARTVTGRTRIALFAGAYHGTFDGVLARQHSGGQQPVATPVAPGTPPGMVEDVVVLNYNSQESIDFLRAEAHNLAAVLVEPVQSRRPDVQPQAFLDQLRRLTAEAGTALIFDDVITGFRVHPAGAQGWFGIQADLVTYGKIAGGGMPVGVVAGKACFMDAIDGGMWQFDDESIPRALQTYYAGTFCKHPLAMAAARALLRRLKSEGPGLQQGLNRRASQFVASLNSYFKGDDVPIRVVHFGSLMRFAYPRRQKLMDLLFYYLAEKGVYIWEGRNCFLSLAHTDEDLEFVVRAVKESVAEMRGGGFLLDVTSASPEQRTDGQTVEPRVMPLTEGQSQIWSMTQMGEDASCAYNESVTLHLRGWLSVTAIRGAFQEIINRHEALRTTFGPEGRDQQIQPPRAIDIPVADLSYLDPADRAAETARWLAREFRQPFNLTTAPLIRSRIVRLDEQTHLQLLTVHHIASDGASVGVLLAELSALYSAQRRGIPSGLPQPMQFKQYAELQAGQQQTAKRAANEDYWLKQFAGSVPTLELPTSGPRPAVQTYAGARETAKIDRSLSGELKRLSAQLNCTLFVTLLAGFKVLLQRLTAQRDIVVGVPAAGQASVGGENVVGYCVNLLPLRSQFDGARTFREYTAYLRDVMLDGFEHQDYSLGSLIKRLNLPQDLSRSPLVSVAFNLEYYGAVQSFDGLDVDIDLPPVAFTKFDMFLNITEKGGELKLDWEYKTSLFDAKTIRRWVSHFQTLLRSIAGNPDGRLSDLALLTKAEKHRLLQEWNDTKTNYPRDRTTHAMVEAQAEASPDAVAVVFADQHLTYGRLNRRANQLARQLQQIGVAPEAAVGICLERSPDLVIGLLAIMKAGGVYVPLEAEYPRERLRIMMRESRARVVLCQEWQEEMFATEGAIVLGLGLEWSKIRQQREDNADGGATADNLAYVMYTSGSTGGPKGACITHRSINRLVARTNYIQLKPSDNVAQVSNSSFDAATFEIWGALANGSKLVIITREISLLPGDFAEQLREQQITTLFLTTALFNELARQAPGAFSALSHLLFGGESVEPGWVREVLAKGSPGRLLHVYGPTEGATFSSWELVVTVEDGAVSVPIGKPLSNTRLYVLDENLEPVAVGVTGELYIGGDGLARGYLNRPGLTADRFVPDGAAEAKGGRLYRTGDLVRRRPGGQIEFIGRRDNQVKVRGFRIELEEVEAALGQHPAVNEAVVVAREQLGEGKRLVAYITADRDKRPGIDEIRRHLKERLPGYMLPSAFVILDELPLTPNGKVDRRALPNPRPTRPDLQDSYVAPRTEVERLLAEGWAQLLKVERVGIYDSFFELGGDSIRAIRIAARARQAGLRFSPMQIFQYPTIAELAVVSEQCETPEVGSETSSSLEPFKWSKEDLDDIMAVIGKTGTIGSPDLSN